MIVNVSAPGKLMVSGEYVVLDGAEALVAAVNARLVAVGSPSPRDGSGGLCAGSPGRPGLPPEALLARQYAEDALGAVPMQLTIDATALRSGELKLGLGSSAAASAAAAGAVLAWHGRDPAEERASILEWALAGHRAVAPEGSGADVAAATLGGVVRFRRDAAEESRSVAWPEGLVVEVVWTGRPARTSDLVRVVRAFERSAPRDYGRAMGALREAADELLRAVLADEPAAVVAAAGASGRAVGALGRGAGADIVTAELAATAALAEAHGGAAKPSGAGGGDVALAFFTDREAAASFRAACPARGLTPLSVRLGEDGVRAELPSAGASSAETPSAETPSAEAKG